MSNEYECTWVNIPRGPLLQYCIKLSTNIAGTHLMVTLFKQRILVATEVFNKKNAIDRAIRYYYNFVNKWYVNKHI